MANYYDSNKTGQEIDAILDGVVKVEINPEGEPTDYFNAIKIGNNIYGLVGAGTTGGNKLYKHTFAFNYGGAILNGVCISNKSTSYITPIELFNSLDDVVALSMEGATILTKTIVGSTPKCYYINNVGAIANVTITSSMYFTSYSVRNY